MTDEMRQIVRRYILHDLNGFIDAVIAATNMTDFKQWAIGEARALEQRRICKEVEHLGIDLSDQSMTILHEADLPKE